MNLTKGTVVLAIAGREKGKLFLVKDTKDNYCDLVNGKERTLENPKKKNNKHLQILCKSEKTGLEDTEWTNEKIKKFLDNYNKNRVK